MTRVELIYDRDCPNAGHARRRLAEALGSLGQPARWTEWERSAPNAPSYVKQHGSPTILVQGLDVAGQAAELNGPSCRLYRDESGRTDGAPAAKTIVRAMLAAQALPGMHGNGLRIPAWRSSLAALPGIVFAFLPNLACPVCWPAYAALLGSMGLGFLLETVHLAWLTALFLALALAALAFRAGLRRGYGPFALGLAASLALWIGKFVFASEAAMYGGAGLLLAASVWNAWPVRGTKAACPACAPLQGGHPK